MSQSCCGPHATGAGGGGYMKRQLNQNLSGNEVYSTNSLILLVKNMLCSRLHGQKGFNSISLLIEDCIVQGVPWGACLM